MVKLAAVGEVSAGVRLEVIELLTRAVEVDLATIYRSLVGLHGSGVATTIGVVISQLLREGAIEIDTRRLEPEGPLIGFVRLVLAVQSPDRALVA